MPRDPGSSEPGPASPSQSWASRAHSPPREPVVRRCSLGPRPRLASLRRGQGGRRRAESGRCVLPVQKRGQAWASGVPEGVSASRALRPGPGAGRGLRHGHATRGAAGGRVRADGARGGHDRRRCGRRELAAPRTPRRPPRAPRPGDAETRVLMNPRPGVRGRVTDTHRARPHGERHSATGGRRRPPRRGRGLDTRGSARRRTHGASRRRLHGASATGTSGAGSGAGAGEEADVHPPPPSWPRRPPLQCPGPAPPQPQASCSPGPQMQPSPQMQPGPAAAAHAEASADPRPQALPAAWQDPRGHRVGSRPEGQAQEPVETHIWGRVGHRCPRGACAHGDSRWQGFPRQGRHASHCGRQTKGPAPRRDHRGERWGQAGSWESLAPGRAPASVTQAGPRRGADAPGQAEGLTPR